MTPSYITGPKPGWEGPKSLQGLALQLASVRKQRRDLFSPGAQDSADAVGGGASAAAAAPESASAASGGSSSSSSGSGAEGAGASSSAASAEAAEPEGWAEVKHQHAFWVACSTLKATEDLFAELAKLPPVAGLVGDGGEEVEPAPLAQSMDEEAGQLFSRLVASAMQRKEDIGGGWGGGGEEEEDAGGEEEAEEDSDS